jgi:hypothetical protein
MPVRLGAFGALIVSALLHMVIVAYLAGVGPRYRGYAHRRAGG